MRSRNANYTFRRVSGIPSLRGNQIRAFKKEILRQRPSRWNAGFLREGRWRTRSSFVLPSIYWSSQGVLFSSLHVSKSTDSHKYSCSNAAQTQCSRGKNVKCRSASGRSEEVRQLNRQIQVLEKKLELEQSKSNAIKNSSKGQVDRDRQYNGVFILLVINLAIFLMDKQFQVGFINKYLYLNHSAPRIWQFVTANFCHASWEHLSNNAVMLYLFGKLVEEEEGSFGVIFAYLVTGIGAMLMNLLLIPSPSVGRGLLGFIPGVGSNAGNVIMSLGASGAVFGMFTITILLKLRKQSLKSILEVVILSPFVWARVSEEVHMQMSGGSPGVSHLAHIAGALFGVMLVLLLSQVPSVAEE